MNCLFCCLILYLAILIHTGCSSRAEAVSQPPQAEAKADEPDEYPKNIEHFFVDAETIAYNGYEVVKLEKEELEEYPPGMKSEARMIPVNYTVIKRGGRILAKFDGFQYGLGNANYFGLFPALGRDTRQLFISQTAPRSGRHWIVDLSSPSPRVIFDSYDYDVGREEVWVDDIDGEGAQAWSFFDREYKRADKKEVKSKIKSVLKNHPIYRHIYGRSAT